MRLRFCTTVPLCEEEAVSQAEEEEEEVEADPEHCLVLGDDVAGDLEDCRLNPTVF